MRDSLRCEEGVGAVRPKAVRQTLVAAHIVASQTLRLTCTEWYLESLVLYDGMARSRLIH